MRCIDETPKRTALPGFAADHSLYASRGSYWAISCHGNDFRWNAISPAACVTVTATGSDTAQTCASAKEEAKLLAEFNVELKCLAPCIPGEPRITSSNCVPNPGNGTRRSCSCTATAEMPCTDPPPVLIPVPVEVPVEIPVPRLVRGDIARVPGPGGDPLKPIIDLPPQVVVPVAIVAVGTIALVAAVAATPAEAGVGALAAVGEGLAALGTWLSGLALAH